MFTGLQLCRGWTCESNLHRVPKISQKLAKDGAMSILAVVGMFEPICTHLKKS
jgi:hypothetical protein